jgi:hypothetical protein
MKTICLVAALAAANSAAAVLAQAPLAQSKGRLPIGADELNNRYVVLGPLGEPLGAVFSVTGHRVDTSIKGQEKTFEVTHISGRPLENPVRLQYQVWPWANISDFEKNQKYELRVYQDGAFTGTPAEVLIERVIATRGYAFTTHLVVVKSLRPEDGNEPKAGDPAPPPLRR